MADVAFIGLGTMGLAMARNIIQGGFQVAGYDMSSAAISRHVENGGIAASSASEAASGSSIAVTMLPVGNDVRSALFEPSGIVEGLSPNALIIDMSTINPFESDGIRADLAVQGHRMVDAPVGRTSVEAETGNSLFMVGGQAADIEEARPILECMGDLIIDCGGPGMGARMKIVNNLMTTVLNVLTAEVLTLADSVGLDRDIAINVMSGTAAGRGHMTTTYANKVLKDDLTPAFMIDLAKKDLKIALAISEQIGVPLGLAREAETIYSDAQEEGRGAEDWTAIYAMLRGKYAT
jgi:4-hydroxybutyrate dehydrogenase/sulfolactaldehyde 3-reductase